MKISRRTFIDIDLVSSCKLTYPCKTTAQISISILIVALTHKTDSGHEHTGHNLGTDICMEFKCNQVHFKKELAITHISIENLR